MPHSFYYMKQTRKWNRKALGAASSFFLLMLLPLSISYARLSQENLAARLAPDILRFHVLANSNSSEDQALKLEVRQLLLDTIYQDITGQTGTSSLQGTAFSKESLAAYIIEHRGYLEQAAESYMHAKGFPYSAEIRIEQCYFPTRQYGDITLPCGTYDAVRVLLGEGQGKNWWCVLYPPLCFSGISCTGQMPDSSRRELAALLPEEDYRSITGPRTIVFGEQEPGAGEQKSAGIGGNDKKAGGSDAVAPKVRVTLWLTEFFGNKGR